MLNKLKKWVANIEKVNFTFRYGSYYYIKVANGYQVIRLLYIENFQYVHFYDFGVVKNIQNLPQNYDYCCDDIHILDQWKEITPFTHQDLSEQDYQIIDLQVEQDNSYVTKMEFFSKTDREYYFVTDEENGAQVYRLHGAVVSINSPYLPRFFAYTSYAVYAINILIILGISKIHFPKINGVIDSAFIYASIWFLFFISITIMYIRYKAITSIIRGYFVVYKEERPKAFYSVLAINIIMAIFIGFLIYILGSLFAVVNK